MLQFFWQFLIFGLAWKLDEIIKRLDLDCCHIEKQKVHFR